MSEKRGEKRLSTYSVSFAKRVKQLRTERFGAERGAQSAAATAMGVSSAEWRGYELGTLPGAERLYQICNVFACDANWLLGLSQTGTGLSKSQIELVTLLHGTRELLHQLDALHTSYLTTLADALVNPSQAQEQCYKLNDLARSLDRVFTQVGKSGPAEVEPLVATERKPRRTPGG